jgi:hypothetical protein
MKSSWLAGVLLVAAAGSAFGQDPRYLLDVEGSTPGKEIAISRPQNGLFPLRVLWNVAPPAGQTAPPAPKPVSITLSQFTGDRGSFAVEILDGCQSTTLAKQPMTFPSTGVINLCLRIPPPPGDGKYTGSMLFASDDAKPLVKPFAITRSQATLIVQPIAPQLVTLPFLARLWSTRAPSVGQKAKAPAPEHTFTVLLTEKSGTTAAEGILAGVVVSKNPGDFDVKKNMAFKINGTDVPNLESSPPATDTAQRDLRRVLPGGQLGLETSLYGLSPGEYNATLRFSSPNSIADDSQKQSLVIQVRDSIWWAIIVLIAAVTISFIGTKVLVALRRRASLQKQIHDLTPQWFSGEPQIVPVVWVRASLHQANRLSSRFWLTSPDLIEQQVNDVRTMLKILDQAHQLREQLSRSLDEFLLRRVLIGLQTVIARLDAGAPDEATVTRIQTDLNTFQDWLEKDKVLAKFQSDVLPAMQSLESEIAAEAAAIPPAAKAIIDKLREEMKGTLQTPPPTIDKMNEAYRDYAQLRALWDERSSPEALVSSSGLIEMLKVADDSNWEQLKKAKLTIRVPITSDPNGLVTYVPLQFSVGSESDDRVVHSYLYKHRIEFAWTFKLKTNRGDVTLKPVSLGPSVVQYFPRSGNVQVSVELRYKGEVRSVPDAEVQIFDSSDFGFFQSFEKVELASWLIAAGAAIVTGLSTFYFKGQAFGSFQDYLSLAVWGAGVDQTKNFVQNLQVFSTTPPTAAGG